MDMKSMLADGVDGSLSSKRVVTFIAFLLCVTAFVSNLFWGLKMDPDMYKGMMYIVIGGLGVTASEKFAPK
jgi:hypothetical protein